MGNESILKWNRSGMKTKVRLEIEFGQSTYCEIVIDQALRNNGQY